MVPVLRGEALARAIAARPPRERDAFVDALLGLDGAPSRDEPCVDGDPELIRCVPSGVSAIADAVVRAAIGPDDVFLDLGAGCGRVAAVVHLLTGARAVGIEIQEGLVAFGRRRLEALGLRDGVELRDGDAREVALPAASVVYLYLPFVGSALARVLRRLEEQARRAPLAVCALGVELGREEWLRPVGDGSLWLTVHEGGGADRASRTAPSWPSLRAIADERARPAAR